MVAADAEGIEFGNILGTEFNHVAYKSNGRLDRKNPGASSYVLFQYIILGGASYLVPGYTLLLCHYQIHSQHN